MAWKKVVLAHLPWKGNKKASIDFCQQTYPNVSLLKTSRCRVPHDGLSDALCLAHYGKMTNA